MLEKIIMLIVPFLASFIGLIMVKYEDKRYALDNKEIRNVYLFDFIVVVLMLVYNKLTGMDALLFGSMFGLLSVSAMVDYKLQELPDLLTGATWILSIAYLWFLANYSEIDVIYRSQVMIGLASFVTGAILAFCGAGFGFGDAKLMLPIGLLLFDVQSIINYWIIAIGLALVHIVIIIISQKRKSIDTDDIKKIKIAFGPYLIMSFALSIVGL